MKRIKTLTAVLVVLGLLIMSLGCAALHPSREAKIVEREFMVKTPQGIQIYVVGKRPSTGTPKGVVLLIPWVKSGSTLYNLPVKGYNLMDYLAKRGFAVYAVDHRSYGKSSKTSGLLVRGLTCAEDMKAVADFIEGLEGVKKVDVVALSFGTVVTVCLAGKYPEEVRRIVLMGYPCSTVNKKARKVVQKLISLAESGKEFIPSRPETAKNLWYRYDPKVLAKFVEIVSERTPRIPTGPFLDLRDWDAKRLLPRVKAPILFIYGDHENFADLEDTRRCFYAFPGEKKAYMLIGNASHGLVLEESHDMVYRAIYGWLSN
ncbi:MAG TPA: alpha/beta fold hydrolase [Deltaproteobacteria bacterium]|nr:alpha/beta fold hydrolase [Deltaproteobacteria bacterium]